MLGVRVVFVEQRRARGPGGNERIHVSYMYVYTVIGMRI